MLVRVIQHQPNRSLAHLRGELVRRFARHGSILSGVGASGKTGAVHCRPPLVLDTIRAARDHALTAGIARPRVAVCGLNPHCGEGGIYGTEDDEFVVPAIAAARAEGIDAYGPIPGDMVFSQAMAGKYDIIVAQFHDQGHIPAKTIGGHATVNITVGLPILRTSVDHGTAFDIAWRGVADPANMIAAIASARTMRPLGQAVAR